MVFVIVVHCDTVQNFISGIYLAVKFSNFCLHTIRGRVQKETRSDLEFREFDLFLSDLIRKFAFLAPRRQFLTSAPAKNGSWMPPSERDV